MNEEEDELKSTLRKTGLLCVNVAKFRATASKGHRPRREGGAGRMQTLPQGGIGHGIPGRVVSPLLSLARPLARPSEPACAGRSPPEFLLEPPHGGPVRPPLPEPGGLGVGTVGSGRLLKRRGPESGPSLACQPRAGARGTRGGERGDARPGLPAAAALGGGRSVERGSLAPGLPL